MYLNRWTVCCNEKPTPKNLAVFSSQNEYFMGVDEIPFMHEAKLQNTVIIVNADKATRTQKLSLEQQEPGDVTMLQI